MKKLDDDRIEKLDELRSWMEVAKDAQHVLACLFVNVVEAGRAEKPELSQELV